MESSSPGLVGRLAEKTASWVILGLLILAGWTIYKLGPGGRDAVWNAAWRGSAWLALAAVVPWLSRPIIPAVARSGTNWAGLGLLAGLFLLDVGLAALLMTGPPGGAWGVVGMIAAAAACATYNFLVTEYLADTTGG